MLIRRVYIKIIFKRSINDYYSHFSSEQDFFLTLHQPVGWYSVKKKNIHLKIYIRNLICKIESRATVIEVRIWGPEPQLLALWYPLTMLSRVLRAQFEIRQMWFSNHPLPPTIFTVLGKLYNQFMCKVWIIYLAGLLWGWKAILCEVFYSAEHSPNGAVPSIWPGGGWIFSTRHTHILQARWATYP